MFNMQKEKNEDPVIFYPNESEQLHGQATFSQRDWMQVFPSRPSMTNESARHIVRAWMIFNGYQSLFCALWLKFSFREFLQLKKERKWWRGRFTVQWQQRKKKFCPELDKRLPLVGIRWGENAMQTLLQQDYRERLLICVCNWFYKLQNWINSKPREIKWP